METAIAAPTLAERIDALEQFLQQLVLLLEVEPVLTAETIGAWITICSASGLAHGALTQRQTSALEQLCRRVLTPSMDVMRPADAGLR
jgi:hypothetical protein